MEKKIYSSLIRFISELQTMYNLDRNLSVSKDSSYIAYILKNEVQKSVDFYLSLSTNINDPRIEIQFTNPYSNDKLDYLIIGEFYDFTENTILEIKSIIKAFLSNSVIIEIFTIGSKIVSTKYSYGYYINDEVQIITEHFKKNFIFPWNKKNIYEKVLEFKPWITSEFTIQKL